MRFTDESHGNTEKLRTTKIFQYHVYRVYPRQKNKMHEKKKVVVNITKINFLLFFFDLPKRYLKESWACWLVTDELHGRTDIRKIIQFLKHTDIQYISTTSKLSQAAAKLIIINSSICSQRVVSHGLRITEIRKMAKTPFYFIRTTAVLFQH